MSAWAIARTTALGAVPFLLGAVAALLGGMPVLAGVAVLAAISTVLHGVYRGFAPSADFQKAAER